MKKFEIKFNQFVRYVLIFLVGLSILGSLSYLPIIFINTNIILKIGFILSLIIVLLLLIYRHKIKKYFNKIFNIARKNKSKIIWVLFLFVILYQIFLVFRVKIFPRWDVENVYETVHMLISTNTVGDKQIEYFSTYPNNRFILFIFYYIGRISRTLIGDFGHSREFFQLINIFVLDISIIIAAKSLKKLFSESYANIFILFCLPLLLSVYMFFPYTDTLVLLFIAISIYLYSLKDSFIKYIWLGMVIAFSYLMKPSSIVFLIAFIICKLFDIKKLYYKILLNKKVLANIFIFGFVFSFITDGFSIFAENQNIIKLKKGKDMPYHHFIAMGLQNAGRYNHKDVNESKSMETKKEKVDFNKKKILKRLSDMNYIGYITFLINKHIVTTRQGDFQPYWENAGVMYDIEEERWITAKNESAIKDMNKDIFKSLYFSYGKYTDFISINMQIMWIITLIGVLLSLLKKDNDFNVKLLKLTLLGAFAFLLLFESGRSRYLIQYIFFINILSIHGYMKHIKKLDNI